MKTAILIVSDSESFRQIVARYLSLLPEAEILETIDTTSPRIQAVMTLPAPDVILIDLNRAALNAIVQLRLTFPQAGIFALTLNDSEMYRDAAFVAGADKFILKTKLNLDLLYAIREFRDSKSLLIEQV